MKLTRRGVFGVSAGAVLGGPAVAKEMSGWAAKKLTKRASISSLSSFGGADCMEDGEYDPLDRYRRRLEALRDLTPEEERAHRLNALGAVHDDDVDVLALKSVSEGQKSRILRERRYRRQREHEEGLLEKVLAGLIRPEKASRFI